MKIFIEHINNSFNYGSLMMAVNIINKLRRIDDNINFYVDTKTEDDLYRLKEECNLKKIYNWREQYDKSKLRRVTQKIIKVVKKDKRDIVIIIGGDDISEYYGICELKNTIENIKFRKKFSNIFLVGQTIGPFSEETKNIVKKCLKSIPIYTRDDKCLEYLNSLNFTNISQGRDLAFLDLPMQDKAKHIISKYKLLNNEYITVVMSGLTKSYTSNFEIYIKEQVNILNNLLDKSALKDKKIVLLPHVLLPAHVDDRLVIKEVMKRLDESKKERIIAIYDEMLASEAREILGNGLFTITGRMHAAVSTFYMRKPAISLSYSVKYSGVIGDGLDMNELVIESADNKLWESGDISKLVDEKVDYILDNYDELIKKIDINVKKTSEITDKQLDDLVDNIKKFKGIK